MTSSQPDSEVHAIKCEMAGEVLCNSGILRLKVSGWSMLPTIWPGDVLIVERATGKQISEGDVILFGRDRRLFAHRVVTIPAAHGGFLTRGDAMQAPDPIVEESELLGKVSFIERGGKRIAPSKPRRSERTISAMVRSSKIAARVIVGVRDLHQSLQR